jgi:hypothetical protein
MFCSEKNIVSDTDTACKEWALVNLHNAIFCSLPGSFKDDW